MNWLKSRFQKPPQPQKPKVLGWIGLSGHFNSGKTEFIRSVSERQVVSTEVTAKDRDVHTGEERYFAFDYGSFTVDKNSIVHLFGEPGAIRWGRILETSMPNHIGMVIMLNSFRPEWFLEARYIISHFDVHCTVPYIIACNFQDSKTAWSPEDLRIVLRIPKEIPVVPCVAKDKESVKGVMLALLEHILETFDADEDAQTEG